MSPLRPRTHLDTHTVTNQPPPFEGVNLFTGDRALREAVAAASGSQHEARLAAFGARMGSAEVVEWADQANRIKPRLVSFDRYGQRLDEVAFHPAYHHLMRAGLEAGISSIAWSGCGAGHVAHAALEFLMAQGEPGVCCPMTMTYAAGAILDAESGLDAMWREKIAASRYDPSSRPAIGKDGVTIGMAMTEKQGGSDLRANTTTAARNGDGTYTLVGHKWFCSAPMSDAFFTLAQAPGGLSCFLVPRWTGAGERNRIEIARLKDKMGDWSNASAEIEYHGAEARLVGEEGHGIRAIMAMVHHTRLDCIIAPAAYMRQAIANALWHAAHRTAYRKRLIDQPLMQAVLADMAVESEAATALAFRVARSFDESAITAEAALFGRIATPVGKYWVNKRVVPFVAEVMEAHGGAGYIEEGVMPRLFRQSPLNSIWEGSGNVICLDVLRAMSREPDSVAAFVDEIEQARGANAALDRAIDAVKDAIAKPPAESAARHLVETMALALQGAVLARTAPSAILDGFCATRLADRPGFAYGAVNAKIDTSAILARAIPQ